MNENKQGNENKQTSRFLVKTKTFFLLFPIRFYLAKLTG